jgi:DNA repair protein RadC
MTITKSHVMENKIIEGQWRTAEIQLSYRTTIKPSQRPKVTSSREVVNILRTHWDNDKIELIEQFKILLVNRANKVLGIFEVSSGGIAGVNVDPKLIFVAALKAGACGIILAHNHPSGNLDASQPDCDFTKKINQGCKLLDICLLDHIIITSESYFSFADEGIL